ncbi:MAG: hypothetical protein AAGD96_06965 [Chloroflexota bacterium]
METAEILFVLGLFVLFGAPWIYFGVMSFRAAEQENSDQLNQALWASQLGLEYLGDDWLSHEIHPNQFGFEIMPHAKLSEVSYGEVFGINGYLADYRYTSDKRVRAYHVIILELKRNLLFNARLYDHEITPSIEGHGAQWLESPSTDKYGTKLEFYQGDHKLLLSMLSQAELNQIVGHQFFAGLFMHDNMVVQYRYGPCPDYASGFEEAVYRLKLLAEIFAFDYQETLKE